MDDATVRETRSLPDLVAQLTGDLASLVRKESELIRAEVSEKLHAGGRVDCDVLVFGNDKASRDIVIELAGEVGNCGIDGGVLAIHRLSGRAARDVRDLRGIGASRVWRG